MHDQWRVTLPLTGTLKGRHTVTFKNKSLWSWARWGLLAMTLLTGIALLLTLWSGYRSAQRIAIQVTRAEGYTLINSIRRKLNPQKLVKETDLQGIMRDLKNTGLRYIGMFRLQGRLVASAGKAYGETSFPVRPGALFQDSQTVGSRVRMQTLGLYRKRIHPWHMFCGNPRCWERRARYRERSGLPMHRHDQHKYDRTHRYRRGHRYRRSHRRPILLVIEFEPLSAKLIQTEAQRALMSGGAATLILLIMTSLFWIILRRLSTLEEQRQREHQLAALGEMSAVMAHEIRNPLTSLKGHAQLLVEYLPDEGKTKAKAERVVYEAERLENLSSQLLEFVRMGTLEQTDVDPVELLQAISETLEPSKFEWVTKAAPSKWRMDETKIRQVFTNLMQNALQASPEDEVVTICIAEEQQQLKISIRDHGDGIAPDDTEKIFAPFYTTRYHGTGLGLAVARRWVELHEGTLTVSHPPDGGAEFVVCLPLRKEAPTS